MKPRILAVFVDRPWPGVTGDMERVRALVAAMVGGADLRIVVVPRPGGRTSTPPPDLSVEEVVRIESAPASFGRFVVGLPSRRPPMMAFYRQPHVREVVARAVASFDPEVVLTHHLGGAAVVDGLVDPSRVVLDLPNDEVQRFGRLAAIGPLPRRLRYRAEAALTAQWCRHHLPLLRAITVVSAEDAGAYRSLVPDASIVVVPNGTSPPARPRPDPGGRVLLFLGDLAYEPNRDGVEWFIEHVLPSLDVEELRVVGRGQITDAPRVVATGFVDDLDVELRRAAAMVVPLRAGGGTRLKVLQAFGWGIPVVSTRLGVEGLGAVPGEHYLAAETPDEWRTAVDALLADADLRQRLATAARALVDDRFTWEQATRPFQGLLFGPDGA